MKNFKHWLATMAVLLCSITTSAAPVKINGIWYNINSSARTAEVTSEFNSSSDRSYSGDIVIPSRVNPPTGSTCSVTSIHEYAFSNCNITSVEIPRSVTQIGNYAFASCKKLTKVLLHEGLTSIGTGAFNGCASLTSITFPEGLTSTGYYAFGYCTSLSSITLPSSVTQIQGSCFEGCSGLQAIVCKAATPPSISSYAFDGVSKSITVYVPASSIYDYQSTERWSEFTNYQSLEDYASISGTCGTNLTWKLNGEGKLTIEGTGEMPDYSGEDEPWNEYKESITSITISEGVTNIGSYAFFRYNNLISINFAEGVTSIGTNAFYECNNLVTITFPESLEKIDNHAFYGCSGLESINLPECTQLASIGAYALEGTKWLNNTSDGILYVGNVLYIYKGTMPENTSIEVREGTKGISPYAFENCSTLISITLPESLTNIGGNAFTGCANLASIIIPEEVTVIGAGTFSGCSSLTSISLPEGVTSIGSSTFSGCTNLANISIPEGVTSIGNSAFSNCTTLTSINLPKSVTSIGTYAFSACNALTTINISEDSQLISIGDDAFASSGLTSITIPGSVTSLGNWIFAWCNNLTSIEIANGLTEIGYYAFAQCYGLVSITIPESVTTIGEGALSGCTNLTTVNIPENSQLTSIGYCAFSSSGLTSIAIPKSVTKIEGYALRCNNLTAITCYAETPPTIEEITFYGVDKSIPVYVPATSIEAYQSADYWKEFTNIKSIPFTGVCGDNLTWRLTDSGELIIKGTGAMYNYTSNESAPWYEYKESITTASISEGVTNIGNYAFYQCKSLTSVTLPEGITSIGSFAFYQCNSLTAIVLPATVTKIDNYAFNYCKGLTSITCLADTPPTCGILSIFDGVDYSIPVYVPVTSFEAYKSASVWKNFTNFKKLFPKNRPQECAITISEYGSGTYCSLYPLNFSEVEGLKAYAATGYDTETGVVTLTRVMTAKAGVGLFIKGEPGEYTVPTLENTSFNTLNMLVGTLEKTELNGTSDDGLYANYKYTIKEGDAEPMFYQFADGSTLSAERAYLQIPTKWLPKAESKAIRLRFVNGETTDIEEVESTDNSEQTTVIYDLMGRRVENPSKGCVYIVNGRKVVY